MPGLNLISRINSPRARRHIAKAGLPLCGGGRLKRGKHWQEDLGQLSECDCVWCLRRVVRLIEGASSTGASLNRKFQ
jgi:hypothetical protein